jgi:protein-disulfide isomerase
MKRSVPLIIVIVVGLTTLGSGFALYRAKRPKQLTMTNEGGESKGTTNHVLGPADASLTLDEFGDFQCPPCGKLSEPINQLQREYNPRLRVVFHHFPLINHQHAREAAWAAEAAGIQGKFWEMHDLIYREQEVWSKTLDVRPLFEAYAGYIGLNLGKFKTDMDSAEVKDRVTADQTKGTSLGVQNTPTIFLNNRQIDPKKLGPNDLHAAIEAELKNAKPSS